VAQAHARPFVTYARLLPHPRDHLLFTRSPAIWARHASGKGRSRATRTCRWLLAGDLNRLAQSIAFGAGQPTQQSAPAGCDALIGVAERKAGVLRFLSAVNQARTNREPARARLRWSQRERRAARTARARFMTHTFLRHLVQAWWASSLRAIKRRTLSLLQFCNHRHRTVPDLLSFARSLPYSLRALRAGADRRAPCAWLRLCHRTAISATFPCCPTCDCVALDSGIASGRSRSIAQGRRRRVIRRFAFPWVEVPQAPLGSLVAQRPRGAASVAGTSEKDAQGNVPDGAAAL